MIENKMDLKKNYKRNIVSLGLTVIGMPVFGIILAIFAFVWAPRLDQTAGGYLIGFILIIGALSFNKAMGNRKLDSLIRFLKHKQTLEDLKEAQEYIYPFMVLFIISIFTYAFLVIFFK